MTDDNPIRFQIRLPHSYCTGTPRAILDVAQAADELGFDGVSVQDHVITIADLSPCGDHHDETGDDRTVIDALQTLAFAAKVTEHVRLATAALDALSGGRLIVGVGVGAPRKGRMSSGGAQNISAFARVSDKEFELFKVTGHRGRIANETLQVLNLLWTEDSASFDGQYYSFDNIQVQPKPVQRPRPPIWIGGRSKAAQERAMTLGDGWIPSQMAAAAFVDELASMRDYADEHGLTPPKTVGVNIFMSIDDTDDEARTNIERGFGNRFTEEGIETLVIYGTPDTCVAKMRAFVDAGVTVFDLKLVPPTTESIIGGMETIQKEVVPALAG